MIGESTIYLGYFMNEATNLLFDVNFAKEQTLYNHGLLLELLDQFLVDNQQITQEISSKAQETPDALHFVLHRLKGVSSNLGCMQLFRVLQTHCHTLSEGNRLTPQDVASVNALIKHTFAALSDYLATHRKSTRTIPAEQSTHGNPKALLLALKANLEDNAFISSEELNQLNLLTCLDHSKALIEQLIVSIEHLEYDDAILLANKLIKQL